MLCDEVVADFGLVGGLHAGVHPAGNVEIMRKLVKTEPFLVLGALGADFLVLSVKVLQFAVEVPRRGDKADLRSHADIISCHGVGGVLEDVELLHIETFKFLGRFCLHKLEETKHATSDLEFDFSAGGGDARVWDDHASNCRVNRVNSCIDGFLDLYVEKI